MSKKNKGKVENRTVVITGSARGFGYEMAKVFKQLNYNIVLSDINKENLLKAVKDIKRIVGKGKVLGITCNVTKFADLQNLYNQAFQNFGGVSIWINNAGVNQPDKPVFELQQKEIDFLLDVDLRGAIYGSKLAFEKMKEQGYGQIYNVEGYGSNDATMTGLSIYGTAKRAITYFTSALAKESKELTKNKVKVCKLSPGIMITEFLNNANGGKTAIELSAKTKKVYNILGDYPNKIAAYVVPKMVKNKRNNKKIVWLTNAKASRRFIFAAFRKNKFFKI